MDQETKQYLERILLSLATRDDIEKVRQESKINFRQLREEEKANVNEWRQEFKKELEPFGKEGKFEIGPIQEMVHQELQKNRLESQTVFEQSNQSLANTLQGIIEELKSAFDHSKQEIGSPLQLSEGMESLREGIKQLTEEFVSIKEKMKEGFVETKDELGSMIKFSYSDLEKKFNALEARIKALEKMVFP
jgi:hypothetical protein